MLGGYQILDLRSIDLTLGSSASNITDIYVLNQLRNLREHIQKDYNFAKPLNNQLKPVLIRYRDKKSGEKHEGAIFGSVQAKTNYYTYEISAILLGQTLNIEVVFEEKTNDDGEKYWDIKTAKILLTKEVQDFENIIDKDGHKRFIEGDITIDEITGLTQQYGKWSLSGTHLLVVLALKVDNATTVNGKIASIDLPDWIKDKIQVIYGSAILRQNDYFYAEDGSTSQTGLVVMGKSGTNINAYLYGFTATADRYTRIQFDLLIDNEQE